MPEARLVVLADHAMVGQDGKVSVIGIFRTINVSGLPAEHPRMYLVVILALDAGPHTVAVQLHRPDGTPAMADPPEIPVHAVAGQDVNVIVELNKLTFGSLGTYQLMVKVDGSPAGTAAVAIEQMTQAGQGARAN